MLLHFIHFLLQHVLMLAATATVGISGDAAGALITGGSDGTDGADGGSGEGAEGEDDGTDDTDSTGDGQSQTEGDKTQDQKTAEGKVDWRTIPPEVKGHIQEIAKTNPKLANMLQNAVYTSNNFLKEVPGGLKEIRALKTSIEELGGLEEIKTQAATYRNLVDEQETLDSKARAGDISVLDTFAEIAGEGFFKLMPQALTRWANQDREGYSHEMGKLMVGAMREGGLVSDLNLAFKMLKLNNAEATKEALECLNRCAEWANGINKLATTAPVKPQVDPKIAEQQRDLDQGRTKLFNEQFSSDFGGWRNKQISDTVATLTNGRQLNEYQMNTLANRIVSDIKDILTSDKDYTKNLQRIYDARDMAELKKFAQARTSKILPEVAKKAYRSLFGTAPATKKTAKPGDKTVKPGQQTTVPVKGWVKVAPDKAPSPDQIDGKKTDFSMKFKKQAILKDGSKVYWGDKVPA